MHTGFCNRCVLCCRQTANILFESFEDAAMVFTDTDVDPEAPAIVVLFSGKLYCWHGTVMTT